MCISTFQAAEARQNIQISPELLNSIPPACVRLTLLPILLHCGLTLANSLRPISRFDPDQPTYFSVGFFLKQARATMALTLLTRCGYRSIDPSRSAESSFCTGLA
jgi:hypothetical protein